MVAEVRMWGVCGGVSGESGEECDSIEGKDNEHKLGRHEILLMRRIH